MSPDSREPALLFVNARQVVTCSGPARARRGAEMAALEVRTDTAVLVEGRMIAAVGPAGELARRRPDAAEVDCAGGVLTPGLVDSHAGTISR